MTIRYRRTVLVSSVSAIALVAALSAPAAAQTVSEYSLDLLDPYGITGAVSGDNPANSIDVIADFQSAIDDTSAATVEDSNAAGTVDVFFTPFDVEINNNTILTVADGNEKENSLGVIPAAPPGEAVDGVAILQGQTSQRVELTALSDGDAIEGAIVGPGGGSAEFTGNAIGAIGSYNRALSTVETGSSLDLEPSTDGGIVFGLPTTEQTANLSVANVQLNSDFAHADGEANVAEVADGLIYFNRRTQVNNAIGHTLFGNFDLSGNAITANANSNLSDNSVLLTDAGATSFGGSVAVSNLQGSEQIGDPDINAENGGGQIHFEFAYAAFGTNVGGGALAAADGLSVTADDNAISSRATINNSRNEIGFDGGLVLEGALVDPTALIAEISGGLPDYINADYTVSNVQAAGDLGGSNRQDVDAETFDALIIFRIEDVDGASTFSFDNNLISAAASGNRATNIISNGEGGSPSVDAIAANFNYQFIEEVNADSDVEDAAIAFVVGRTGDPLTPSGVAFGGFEGSSLSVTGNEIAAGAFGNEAVAVNSFNAVSLSTDYDTGAGPNNAAIVNSINGLAGVTEDHRINAGSAIISAQTLEGGDNVDVEGVRSTVEDGRIIVDVSDPDDPIATDGNGDEGLGVASIDVDGNRISAEAFGNSFIGGNLLTASSSFVGSGAILATQQANGINVEADVDVGVDDDSESGIFVELGFETPTATDLNLSVDGNVLSAFASINTIVTESLIETVSLEGGADDNSANATVFGSDDPGQIAGRNRVRADGSLIVVTDQENQEGAASAEVEGSVIVVTIGDGGNDGVLESSALSVQNNAIAAQNAINDADNTLSLVATSATTTGEGALGGIVSQQVNAHDGVFEDVPQETPENYGDGAFAFTNVEGSSLDVNVTATDSSDLAINGNFILSYANGNFVQNYLSADIGTLTQDTTSVTGANLLTTDSGGGTGDVDLDISSAGLFILNSQRNEALDPGDNTAPDAAGPTVFAYFGSEAAPNSITVNIGDGVANSDLTNSDLDVLGNALVGRAWANDAINELSLSVNSGDANAGLLNSQINSGAVGAFNSFSSITTNLFGENNATVSVTMDGNQIGSGAFGNNASNSIAAEAGAAFSGTAQSGGTVASAGTGGTNVLNNGEIDAHGNLVLLNTQTAYAVEGDGTPFGIVATTTDGSIALNAGGDTEDGSFSLSNNRATANASANNADNSITVAAGAGGLPSATIVGVQRSTGTSVSASISGTDITGTIGGTGALTGGGFTMSGNTIGATSSINSGSNTIGSPGQTFTRTASF